MIIDGYGVCFENIEFQNMKTLTYFIENHCSRLWKNKLHSIIDHRPEDYSDFEEFFRRTEDYKGCGPAEILMDALYHTYHLWMNVEEGADEKLYVLYLPCYPWEYNSEDKKLTKETLSEHFTYMLTEMLGYLPDMSCMNYYNVERENEDEV